jgi:uncharacterized membrane protein YkvA (DUF1232 family)
MWQMVRETLSGKYRMSGVSVVVAIVSVAYVVYPFDLLPDFIPLLGWADDGGAIFILLRCMSWEAKRYNRHKAAGRRTG